MSPEPRLGFVIVTFKCKAYVLACLASMEQRLPAALAHTVVVDNASGDDTLEAVKARFPAVRTLQQTRNLGFAAGVNVGIRALDECDVICLLNPDTRLLDSHLEDAAQFLRDEPTAGIAGARIENPDGSIQASCRAFPGYLTAIFNRHSLTTKLAPNNRWSQHYLMTDWPHDEVRDVDWLSGACMLIHRRTIERIGLLDEHYFFSIEDVDYCRRAHDAGLRVVYYPMARIDHRIGRSSRHAAYRAMTAHHQGMWRYYRTHMDGNIALDVLTAAGIGGRLGLHVTSYTLRRAMGRP
jgi:N-acetylglucosaminyl-diphospho-decaprenol L-rhamnosyltransferase